MPVVGPAAAAFCAATDAPIATKLRAAADSTSGWVSTNATHARMYQAASVQAAAIHDMFVNMLGTSAGSYAATEAANAAATS
ncbi:PE family protein [Mycobacterium kyorinense]|uniref:PE family protein n=1 Tax=Mycobacterium kyorinense TaxID=487514 RepID=UPI001E2B7208|nr:PE family protein [Mycobacterium kyorinense]